MTAYRSPDDEELPRAWKRKPPPKLDVRSPQASLFDFPLRQAAEAKRDTEFVAPVLATPTRELQGMVRGEGPIESQAASCKVLPHLTTIQAQILEILASDGPHNATELERRAEFRALAPSTCRKRISELKAMGKTEQVGRRDGMAVWDVAR